MTPSQIVESKLLPFARKLPNSKIVTVNYWVLEHESAGNDIVDSEFYFGGEVELQFENSDQLFVSWDRVAGWREQIVYSLYLGSESAFSQRALCQFTATYCPTWLPHIGLPIEAVSLLGTDGVPFVRSLKTRPGTVHVGSSDRTRFGDGDDVLVTTAHNSVSKMATIWRASID